MLLNCVGALLILSNESSRTLNLTWSLDSKSFIENLFSSLSPYAISSGSTTFPGIPPFFRVLLNTFASIDESMDGDYPAKASVDILERDCVWNGAAVANSACLPRIDSMDGDIEREIDSAMKDLDIVIPSIRDLEFLNAWRPQIEGLHVIIIQDGDPSRVLHIPDWVDYELYSHIDIDRHLGTESWIISKGDASIRNFGFLVSKKKFVWTLDDDCLPVDGQNAPREHLRNLLTPSIPHLFNTLHDPYRVGSDFVRGYPYSLRNGVKTAVSHGLWLHAPDYDAPTQLLKQAERNTILVHATDTVPHGVMFPMCSMNVAFNTDLLGPAVMQGLMGKGQPWARYDDMLSGWAIKVVTDHLNIGVKSGLPYIRHNKASNPFVNLSKEYLGLFWQEHLIPYFKSIRLPPAASSSSESYVALADLILTDLGKFHPYFIRLSVAMVTWVKLWDISRAGKLVFIPSRKSEISSPIRRVAVFTIVRNEPVFLPIWVRYYSKHFANRDIYIIDNGSTDNSTKNLPVQVLEKISDGYFDHKWLTATVSAFQAELLNSGYTHVLFAEADEIVVADPALFPHGLREYVATFSGLHTRVTAWEVVEQPGEYPCNFERTLLSARRYFKRDSRYDKPLLSSLPLSYTLGFHGSTPLPSRDNNLWMLHLNKACRLYAHDRAMWKAKQVFREDEVLAGHGTQHHLTENTFDAWFTVDLKDLEMIPQSLLDPPIV